MGTLDAIDPLRSWAGSKSRSAAVPCRAEVCYSFRSEAREASGGETPRVHHAARRRGRVADGGARVGPEGLSPWHSNCCT